jgi:hypothetical protein
MGRWVLQRAQPILRATASAQYASLLRPTALSRVGLHWEALDEDISVAGLLAGRNHRQSKPLLNQ